MENSKYKIQNTKMYIKIYKILYIKKKKEKKELPLKKKII